MVKPKSTPYLRRISKPGFAKYSAKWLPHGIANLAKAERKLQYVYLMSALMDDNDPAAEEWYGTVLYSITFS